MTTRTADIKFRMIQLQIYLSGNSDYKKLVYNTYVLESMDEPVDYSIYVDKLKHIEVSLKDTLVSVFRNHKGKSYAIRDLLKEDEVILHAPDKELQTVLDSLVKEKVIILNKGRYSLITEEYLLMKKKEIREKNLKELEIICKHLDDAQHDVEKKEKIIRDLEEKKKKCGAELRLFEDDKEREKNRLHEEIDENRKDIEIKKESIKECEAQEKRINEEIKSLHFWQGEKKKELQLVLVDCKNKKETETEMIEKEEGKIIELEKQVEVVSQSIKENNELFTLQLKEIRKEIEIENNEIDKLKSKQLDLNNEKRKIEKELKEWGIEMAQ